MNGLISMWVRNATKTSAGVIGPGPVRVPYAVAMELFHSRSAHFGDKPTQDRGASPRPRSDWAFRAESHAGPDIFRSYKAWWDQDRFDRLWTPEADIVADDLAGRYWFAWPWLIGRALVTAAPETAEQIKAFAADPNRPGPRSSDFDSIAAWGSFQLVRSRRTWPVPNMVVCPICKIEFWNGDISPWMFHVFGPARYCGNCCNQARSYQGYKSDPPPIPSREDVIAALRQYTAAFESIPSQDFGLQVLPNDASDSQRDTWMCALIAMPTPEVVKGVLDVKDWLSVLKVAGLVQDGLRQSRGTWCHARDGHLCRSLLEKSIDDWFTSHGIPHKCEPYWPVHSKLNPSGRKRADWLMQDGTYVECAGMLEDPDYAIKISNKRELARVLAIPLLVIGPTDLPRLPQIFESHKAALGDAAQHPRKPGTVRDGHGALN